MVLIIIQRIDFVLSEVIDAGESFPRNLLQNLIQNNANTGLRTSDVGSLRKVYNIRDPKAGCGNGTLCN